MGQPPFRNSSFIEALEPRQLLAATLQTGGDAGQWPSQFVWANGKLLFSSYGGETGQRIFVTGGDATAVTQLPVTDPNLLTAAGNIVYFQAPATNSDNSWGLWSTDGTAANTKHLVDVPQAANRMFPFKDGVVFPMSAPGPYANNIELYWAHAGKVERIKDINPGDGSSVANFDSYPEPSGFLSYKDQLFFPADDGYHGSELWRTDGTDAGTVMLKDIHPIHQGNLYDTGSEPGNFIRFGSSFLFTANSNDTGLKLWISNGTSAGTRVLYDFKIPELSANDQLYNFCVAGSLLYFQVQDTRYNAPAEYTLWRTDGTTEGTFSISTLGYAGDLPTAFKGSLYFWRQQYSDSATEPSVLWRSDGTSTGTVPVKSFDDGLGRDRAMAATDGSLYFNAEVADNDVRLWQSDGTAQGTVPVISSDPLEAITGLTPVGNKLYFAMNYVFKLFSVTDEPPPPIPGTGTITGVVFNDLDHDGVRDENEPALPGYRVFLDSDGDGVCDVSEASVRSSSSGRYTFSNLPIGKYIVAEAALATRGPTTPTAYTVKLQSAQRVTRSFGNAGGIVTGAVFLDINRDGARDANEVGIPRAHVFLDLDNDGTWDANEPIVRTGSTGRYTFSDCAAGTWRIRVLPIPNMFFTAGNMRRVTLAAGSRIARNFGVLGG